MFDSYRIGRRTSGTKSRRSRRRNGAAQRRLLGSSLLRLEWLEDRRLLSTATATILEGFPSTSQYGQPVALVAKVTTSPSSAWGSGPTGTVDFFLGSPTGTSLGSATVTKRGTATLYQESTPLPVGATDAIYAVYSGDPNFSGSQANGTETVNPASTTTVVSASPNPGVAGANVTFTATVSGTAPNWANNGGTTVPPTGTVTFTVNGAAVPAGSAASPLSLRGGQTFSVNYSSATPTTPDTVAYVDTANGINLVGSITSVVFSANGEQAEISGTGTNGVAATPVNFTMFVSTEGGGWSRKPDFSTSIVANAAVSGLIGTGFEYQQSGVLASGNTVTIDQTGSTATIPTGGPIRRAHHHVLTSWRGDGHGSDGDGSARGSFSGGGLGSTPLAVRLPLADQFRSCENRGNEHWVLSARWEESHALSCLHFRCRPVVLGGDAPYCATKWAIEGLTRALAAELPAGMAAVPVIPGIIDTAMLRSCFGADAGNYPDPAAWAEKAVPFLLGLGPKDNGKPMEVPE